MHKYLLSSCTGDHSQFQAITDYFLDHIHIDYPFEDSLLCQVLLLRYYNYTLKEQTMNYYGKLTSEMKPCAVMASLVILILLGSMSFSKPTEAHELSFPTAIRRLDCKVFCSKTGFSGYVGGCQCGFTLFSNKRSQPPVRSFMKPSTEKLFYELGTFDESADSEEVPEMAVKAAKNANLYAAIAAKLNSKVTARQSNSNSKTETK